jgi:hypothetical protein
LQADVPPITSADRRKWLDEHKAWLKRTFPEPISPEQANLVDQLLAGE